MTAKEASVADGTEVAEDTEAAEVVDDTEVVEAADDTDVVEPADAPQGGLKRFAGRLKRRPARRKNRWSTKVGFALLALLVVASLSVLGWQLWFYYRPDRAVDAASAKAAVTAASAGAVAVLTYSPDTLEHDFSSARSHLTGGFLSYYDNFSQQIIAPAARQKAMKTTAVVLRGAVTELHRDSATVLLFVNQSTQTKDRPEPSTISSTILVKLTKVDGTWLISQFDPA